MSNHGLTPEVRRNIESVVNAWRIANGLSLPPLFFSGSDGQDLCTRQFVGVIEVGDVTLEIFPKLDQSLLASDSQALEASSTAGSVMSSLMWMLEAAEHRTIVEAATAQLQEEPTSFFDLFAYLLGRNLLPELERGVSHSYVGMEDDLTSVRGRIGISIQATKNWNRYDRIHCDWDEFTPDNYLNRALKSACKFLAERVKYTEAMRVLEDCHALLVDADDLHPVLSQRQASRVRFDRTNERFKTSFELALRLLSGIGHTFGVGRSDTFVFLIDMNQLFEAYVHSVLESHFQTAVQAQVDVGTLLRLQTGGIRQVADFVWRTAPTAWIGDAKYKHIAADQSHALKFKDLDEEAAEPERGEVPLAGHVLSSGDVRQLTVYAELFKVRAGCSMPPNLMLLYPFIGDAAEAKPDKVTAWNGSEFWLVPVLVKRQGQIGHGIQGFSARG